MTTVIRDHHPPLDLHFHSLHFEPRGCARFEKCRFGNGQVDEYDSNAAHVELARKMRVRDPATAPVVGDRIPFVIIKATKGAKASRI